MKGAWPKVQASWCAELQIWHSLPNLGNAETHSHVFEIEIGWTHEINPKFGHSFPLDKTQGMLEKLFASIRGLPLNEVLPSEFPPTAENFACWMLARCPGFVDFIEIRAYDGYRVRVQRGCMRSEMAARYLNGDAVLELTT